MVHSSNESIHQLRDRPLKRVTGMTRSRGKMVGFQRFIQCLGLLAIIFVMSACNGPRRQKTDGLASPLTTEERRWMTRLFDSLMFAEGGVFVLWGSKPMTEMILYHYTEEEIAEALKTVDPEQIKNCYVYDDGDLEENWARWEQVSSKFPMKRYLLFRSHDSEDGHATFIYFVDVLRTATVIQDNYELFSQAIGFDFHPLEVVLEMPNRESAFWKRLEESDERNILWGLLFGFGRQNAYGFHWRYRDCPSICESFFQNLPNRLSNPWPVGQVRIDYKNFEIPSFATFSDDGEDEVIKKYEKELEAIRAIYRKGDRLEITLKKLTS